MISSLLHLVGLRPRVYYTLTNFRGGGGGGVAPPPQYANVYVQLRTSRDNDASSNSKYVNDFETYNVKRYYKVIACQKIGKHYEITL